MVKKELLTGFGDYLSYERRYSAHTVDGYLLDIGQFSIYLQHQYGGLSEKDVTHQHIRSWVVAMLQDKMSPVSVRRKLSSLSQLFKWLRKKGAITHNPLTKVHLPKTPARLPSAIPESAVKKLWQSFEVPIDEVQSQKQLRDQVLIALLYGAGLRRSEAIQLTWKDIDFSRQTMLIIGKGKKYRQLPLHKEILPLLAALKTANQADANLTNEHVLLTDSGKPCYPKFVHNRVVEMLKTVTTAAKKSPHVLRHSMATHMMDHGAELNAVKSLLGHSSLAATQVYTHNSITRLKEVYRKSHPGAL